MVFIEIVVCGLFLLLGCDLAMAVEFCLTDEGYDYCEYGCCDDGCCLALVPIIVGSVIGGIILIALIITVICCCIKTGHRKGQVVAPVGATAMVQPPPYSQAVNQPYGHGYVQPNLISGGIGRNTYGLGNYGQTTMPGAPQYGMQTGFGPQPVFSTQSHMPNAPPPPYGGLEQPPPVGSHAQPSRTDDSSNLGAPAFPPAHNTESTGIPAPAQY